MNMELHIVVVLGKTTTYCAHLCALCEDGVNDIRNACIYIINKGVDFF